MARGLLGDTRMTTLAALTLAIASVALCSPVFADSAPARPSFKLRVTVHDGANVHSFRVIVGPSLPCATANQKLPEHEVELRACAPDDSHLQIEWHTRRGQNESRGSSAFPIEPGTTVMLGNERDARIEVAIQG
jgi:hypothetical protein